MADKKITELNLLTYATAASGDLLIIEDIDGAETKAITAENLAKYALGNRTIGGTTAGDIVTIDGTQTLTNKAITRPSVNGGAALTVTSDELNKLDGVTAVTADFNAIAGIAAAGVTPTELGYVNGVTSGIQAQLNSLATAIPGAFTRTWTYGNGFTTGGAETTHKIAWDADILAYLSLSPTSYKIDPTSVTAQLWTTTGGYTNICLGSTGPNVAFTTTTTNGQTYLNTVTFSGLSVGTAYAVALTFRIMGTSGV